MSKSQSKIFSSFIWKFLEQVATQFTGIVFQILLARLLDPKDFGNLAILITFTNFALIFIQSGITVALIQKTELEEYDICSVFLICLLIAAVLYVVLFFSAPLIAGFYEEPNLVGPLRILSIVLFIGAINSIQIAILTRAFKFKIMFFCNFISAMLSGTIGIVLAIKGYGIWALVYHTLLNRAIVTIVMAFFVRVKIKIGISRNSIKNIFSFSIKILAANLVSGTYDSFRTLIIGKNYSKEKLAYYDKAYTYSSYISQLSSNCISGVLLPVFSEKQDNINQLKGMVRKSVRLTSFLMFPVFIGVAVIAYPFVMVLLTEKWIDCVPFLIIFCLLRLPGCITQIDKQILYSLKKGSVCLIYEIIILLLNLGAVFAFINFGIIYIALAALAVEYIGFIAYSIISFKIYGYSLRERIMDMARPLISTLIMVAIIYPISLIPMDIIWILTLQIVFGIAFYILLTYLIDREDFNYFLEKIANIFKKASSKAKSEKEVHNCQNLNESQDNVDEKKEDIVGNREDDE